MEKRLTELVKKAGIISLAVAPLLLNSGCATYQNQTNCTTETYNRPTSDGNYETVVKERCVQKPIDSGFWKFISQGAADSFARRLFVWP